MRIEEQTWQLLYNASIITLKKCFELEFEKRQGFSDLELICAELLAIDESRESRKQMKKERKKQKKQVSNEMKQRQRENCTNNRYEGINTLHTAGNVERNVLISEANECHAKNENDNEDKLVKNIDGKNKEEAEDKEDIEVKQFLLKLFNLKFYLVLKLQSQILNN